MIVSKHHADCPCVNCAWVRLGGQAVSDAFDTQVALPAAHALRETPQGALAASGQLPPPMVAALLLREMRYLVALN